jgi:hypothetical protein
MLHKGIFSHLHIITTTKAKAKAKAKGEKKNYIKALSRGAVPPTAPH